MRTKWCKNIAILRESNKHRFEGHHSASRFAPYFLVGEAGDSCWRFCRNSRTSLRKDYHQSFAQPDFGADLKKGLSGDFLLIFLCLRPKRAPEKSARNPGYQRYARKSGKSPAQFPQKQEVFPVPDKGRFPFGKRGAKATQNGNPCLLPKDLCMSLASRDIGCCQACHCVSSQRSRTKNQPKEEVFGTYPLTQNYYLRKIILK